MVEKFEKSWVLLIRLIPKFRKIPLETSQWISGLVAGQGPSYLQKLNCVACCPWNFEALISQVIFN